MPDSQPDTFDSTRYTAILQDACGTISLNVNANQQAMLLAYLQLLVKWNKAFNLTAVRNPEDMLYRHLIDSLSIAPFISAQRILDVGTGPGLPGIPLAIMYPERHFVLLDSNSKKTRFLMQARIELGVSNVQVEHKRVEAFSDAKGFQQIVSRAFASIDKMIFWCKHLLTEDGEFLAMKGPLAMEEWHEVSQPGFALSQTKELMVPGCEASRQLIIIRRSGL